MKEIIRNILREHTKEITELRKKTTDEFKAEARKIWGDKYNYDKVVYNGDQKNVIITCPIEGHGDFTQTPNNHLRGREGCDKCASNTKYTTSEFIQKAEEVHGKKYDYSKVDYDGMKTPVTIICPIHGDFPQRPESHLRGDGCRKCKGKKISDANRDTQQEFENKSRRVHGNKYDYTKADYQGSKTKVIITCPIKGHGDFEQTPNDHINKKAGCPICSESKGEKFVASILDKLGVSYQRERRFHDCRGICNLLPFDFYIPEINTCIEYDGIQHYEPVFGEENFKRTQASDQAKNVYCEEKGINLIRIPYTMNFKDIPSYIIKEIGL
jgi:hypothetical protein